MPNQRPSIFPRKVCDLVWLKLTLPRKSKLARTCNNGGFVQDYQFSTKRRSRRKTKARRDLCPMLFVFACLGSRRDESERRGYPIEGFSGFEELEDMAMLDPKEEETMADWDWEEGGSSSSASVDERAEKFIQKFYQQMRMQRLQSS